MSPKDEKVAIIRQTYRKLWSLAHKFSNHNSKITTEMERFIKENYLDETFILTKADGTQKELPMFVTGKPRKGGQTVYFDPRAMDTFTARHQDELKQKADELEEKSEFISLRNLARNLKLYSSANEKLFQLIEKKAFDDTFITTDEMGNEVELPIFEYPENKMNKAYLSIRKDGVPTFIQNHKEALREIGVHVDDYTNETLSRPEEDMLTPRELAELLGIKNLGPNALFQFYKMITTSFSKINIKEHPSGKIRPLFQKRWYRSEILCLHKDDLNSFVFKAQKQLKKLGVPPHILNHYLFKEELHAKTDEMITISSYLRDYLHSNELNDLSQEIRANHLSDRYIVQDENGVLTEKPVFLKIRNTHSGLNNYVFASREALFAFTKNNEKLLLSKGVTPYRYQNLLREENAQSIPEGEAVSVSELVANRIISPEKATAVLDYIDETFTSFTNHYAERRPYGYQKRDERKGFIKTYLLKEGLFEFLTNHQNELNIQQNTLDALSFNMPIHEKESYMLSMSDLLRLLGRNERQANELKSLIKKNAIQATYTSTDGDEKNIFLYAHTRNGQTALFIDVMGVSTFLTRYTQQLKKIGITPKHIHTALTKIHQSPNIVEEIATKRQQDLITRKQRDAQKGG